MNQWGTLCGGQGDTNPDRNDRNDRNDRHTHTHTHTVKRAAGTKWAKELTSEYPQIVLVRRGSAPSDNGSPLGAFLQVAINPVHGWGEKIMGNNRQIRNRGR